MRISASTRKPANFIAKPHWLCKCKRLSRFDIADGELSYGYTMVTRDLPRKTTRSSREQPEGEVRFSVINPWLSPAPNWPSRTCIVTQSAIRRAFAWKNGNEIHNAVTRRRDREYH